MVCVFVCWAAQKVLIDCCEYGARRSLGKFRVKLTWLYFWALPVFPTLSICPDILAPIRHWRNPFPHTYTCLSVLGKLFTFIFSGFSLFNLFILRWKAQPAEEINAAGQTHCEIGLNICQLPVTSVSFLKLYCPLFIANELQMLLQSVCLRVICVWLWFAIAPDSTFKLPVRWAKGGESRRKGAWLSPLPCLRMHPSIRQLN